MTPTCSHRGDRALRFKLRTVLPEVFATVACLMVWHGGRVEIVIDLDDH